MKAKDILKKEKDKKNKIRELLKEELECALKENRDTDLQELVNKISDSIEIIEQTWQWLSLWILFTQAVLRNQDIKIFLCLFWFDFNYN